LANGFDRGLERYCWLNAANMMLRIVVVHDSHTGPADSPIARQDKWINVAVGTCGWRSDDLSEFVVGYDCHATLCVTNRRTVRKKNHLALETRRQWRHLPTAHRGNLLNIDSVRTNLIRDLPFLRLHMLVSHVLKQKLGATGITAQVQDDAFRLCKFFDLGSNVIGLRSTKINVINIFAVMISFNQQLNNFCIFGSERFLGPISQRHRVFQIAAFDF